MSFCIIAVFAAMLEFAMVNTLARKEIRRLSMRARKHEMPDANSPLPSDMVMLTPPGGTAADPGEGRQWIWGWGSGVEGPGLRNKG